MLPFFSAQYGNPSSSHILGREAARAVAKARGLIAETINCDESEICFMGGATEANNTVLFGIPKRNSARKKIVVSSIEHKSVLGPCEQLATMGFEIATLPVTRGGIIDLSAARDIIDDETLLVSIQGANNEIGTIQPVSEIADLAHAHGALVHCDAVQLLGKLPVSVYELGADFVSFSAHKVYGPKGIGFLVVRNNRRNSPLSPVFWGGGQENGLRPGTLNVSGIVGTGEACRLCTTSHTTKSDKILALRNLLEKGITRAFERAVIVGLGSDRLPGTSSIMFRGLPSDVVIARTPNICMSSGSACTSGAVSPSHVLLAMGISREDAKSTIRFSLGRYNTAGDVRIAVQSLTRSISEIEISPAKAKR